MAEDKFEPRETNWRQLLPWIELFQGFRVALDLNKLLLAAAGILTMAFGWWLLAVIFDKPSQPDWPSVYKSNYPDANVAWSEFKKDREKWNILHAAAGDADSLVRVDAADLAESADEYEQITKIAAAIQAGKTDVDIEREALAEKVDSTVVKKGLTLRAPHYKTAGQLRTWPFFENRGRNPYLLVTGQAGQKNPDGTVSYVPWQRGDFGHWLLTEQGPVLVEPLVKFLRPVVYFFNPKTGSLTRFYLILVILVTVATWALFGGAITRIAAVQVARKEKIGIRDALRFTTQRYLSYFSGPVFPLLFATALVVLMILFGFLHLIPVVGEIVDGVLWVVILGLGLVMAVVLVGLVGWPLMSATISAEGTDSWEAVSRSYSYVFQAPWHFIWYSLVAIAYGAVVVFFVGFMGSLTVYLGKWGVSQTPGATYFNRDPGFLFVWSPSSFGWRELLLADTKLPDGRNIVQSTGIDPTAYNVYVDSMSWWNKIGATFVAVWINLVFLMILGFGYSYFWSSNTIIYLLMRRKVDDAELDEVYLEEEEDAFPEPTAPAAAASATGTVAGPTRTMVEAPAFRPAPAAPPTLPEPAASPAGAENPPHGTDGNSPPGGAS